MPGSALDETEYAQKVAKFLGTNHHVLELKEAGLQILDDIGPLLLMNQSLIHLLSLHGCYFLRPPKG